MANIFNKTNYLYENPKRNTFDLSFQNNLTLNMGELVPVFCKECLPGDSFKIDPTISLRMMPLLFPVQTRLRAHLHFFYVTNRSLWKDWHDFICNTRPSLELPYITPRSDFKTGKLADYLGIPTTVVSGTPTSTKFKFFSGDYINQHSDNGNVNIKFSFNPVYGEKPTPIIYRNLSNDNWFTTLDYWSLFSEITGALGISGTSGHNVINNLSRVGRDSIVTTLDNNIENTLTSELSFVTSTSGAINVAYYCPFFPKHSIGSNGDEIDEITLLTPDVLQQFQEDFGRTPRIQVLFRSSNSKDKSDELLIADFNGHNTLYQDGVKFRRSNSYSVSTLNEGTEMVRQEKLGDFLERSDNVDMIVIIPQINAYNEANQFGYLELTRDTLVPHRSSIVFSDYYAYSNEPQEILDNENNAYISDIRISALPWRAYEAIYNSFYRDERNNPLIVDGEPVYNKFLRNYNGGEDTIVNRDLYKRNWESDFLTTAVQSPQQGVAPLVGITVNGEISFKDSDTGEIYSAKLNSSDGDKIDNFTVTSPNMPNANLRQLLDFASSGISISDLRGVNALQRWLEINMRRGLRYKDQIMSHFGVNVRYDELIMPEFIGGMSTDIYINQINQTTPTSGSPLGSFAGQGGAFGNSAHSINHYCQEHGYIIGILSISPTPQYSQLLPKHLLKRELLDYFFPEFGHLGMQPITYKEVAPNESFATGQSLDDVFGYQRAWYDYLASVDEVHGLFRTNLNNFVVQRYFDGRPDLSPDFLTIDPKTLDSVFAVNAGDDSHKFLGQVYFDCRVKRPIPEYGVPRLEV